MRNINRREFAAASLAASVPFASAFADSDDDDGISYNNAAIHQEISLLAAPDRVYRILTTAEFDRVVQRSAAMTGAMGPVRDATPSMIDPQEGGAFSFFGGYVTGRNIALVPGALLVQAWRAGSWDPGIFSIARFSLIAQGADTRLVFDHSGFPSAAASHLAKGWYDNYWTPMAKVLAT